MRKTILIGCFEVPGYGGASTVAYRMFEDLRDEFELAFINIISQEDAAYLRVMYGEALGNPRHLPSVYNLFLDRAPFSPSPAHPHLTQLIDALAPDFVVGIDFIATLLLKSSAPNKRVIFITAGCDQAKQAIVEKRVHSVSELLTKIARQNASRKFHLPPRIAGVREAQAVECADLILLHSDMMRPLYEFYFPAHVVKLFPETLWHAEWVYQDAAQYSYYRKPFAERAIDVLLVASHWSRPEKNWGLARELILRHPELNIHVVGDTAERVGRATYHGLLADRAALFALMGDARMVVSPSCLDTAPGVLFEAAVMGCNVVASKNCGNWGLCHPALLADSLRAQDFGERIRLARAREYQQNPDAFLQPSARQTLIEILEVFE